MKIHLLILLGMCCFLLVMGLCVMATVWLAKKLSLSSDEVALIYLLSAFLSVTLLGATIFLTREERAARRLPTPTPQPKHERAE